MKLRNYHLLLLRQEPQRIRKLHLYRLCPHPSSSPYDTIHEDLALYKTKTHLDPMDQFFAAVKNLKSLSRTSSAMFGPEQHAKTYMRACKIESYEEDGEVNKREKLLVRPHDPIFMKEHVFEKFVFGKPFFTNKQLPKRPFPLRQLHRNIFYSGARIGSIDFEDLWFMFHQKWLDMNLLVVFCLKVHSCSFNLLNTLLAITILIHFLGMISCYIGCNSWTM
jgi:hypothetical protein